MSETLTLKNINVLTKEQYNNISNANIKKDELYLIPFDGGVSQKYLIESYKNGTNWYRIYSDGWIEQGGVIEANASSVTYLKKFVDTNYTALMVGRGYSDYDQYLGTSTYSTTGFTVLVSTKQRSWSACGY